MLILKPLCLSFNEALTVSITSSIPNEYFKKNSNVRWVSSIICVFLSLNFSKINGNSSLDEALNSCLSPLAKTLVIFIPANTTLKIFSAYIIYFNIDTMGKNVEVVANLGIFSASVIKSSIIFFLSSHFAYFCTFSVHFSVYFFPNKSTASAISYASIFLPFGSFL